MPDNFNTKRIKDWGKVATRLMLAFGNFIPLDGPNGTFKVPAEFFSFIENFKISQAPGYVYAITDANDVFLFGIKSDGSVDWAKGIPEHLQNILNNIAASLETKADKVPGKGLVNSVFADGVSVVSNDEYSFAVLDASGSVLFGVEKDGTFVWSKGVPGHIQATLEQLIYGLTTKADKVPGKGLVNSVFADGVNVTIDKEFALAFTDANNLFLFGIRKDGSIEWTKGIPQAIQKALAEIQSALNGKQDTIVGKTLIDTQFSSHTSSNDNPEWFWTLVDTANKIIEGIKTTGERVFKLPVQFDGGISWSKDNLDDLSAALKANGFTGGTGDWSDNESLEIPIPKMAIVNFTNIDQMPQTKTTDAQAIMEFWDMNGNYFKKNVIVNAQGSSSMKWSKKNIAIDICNDDWIGDDTFKIKFGDWVPQDSFHIKAYATDYFKCVALAGYDIVKEMADTRPLNTTWKQSLNYGNNPIATKGVSTRLDSGALCFPQGFICKVYLNGNFEGLFCWQLKKHRDNYNMNKKTLTNIHIEGMLGASYFWNGTIDWTQFEIRNPKSLITYTGEDYDGDNPTELIDSTSPVYDATNSKHAKTAIVKQYIINLSQRMLEIANAGANSKALFEQYFGLDSCIDYAVLSDAVYNYDYIKNIQWTTWDGEKWFVNFYDMDCILGANSSADSIHYPTTTHTTTATMHPLKFVVENYTTELEARWAELRDLKIIDAKNIAGKIDHYVKTWGADAYDAENEKWPDYPYDRDMVVNSSYWELEVDSDGNPVIYTTEYHPWNSSSSYAADYVVSYNPSTSSQSSQGWWYRFTALQTSTNQKPVTQTGFRDNIFRPYNWLVQQISNMDTLYNYNNA